MCGIAGIMYKRSRSRGLAPVGDQLVKMLETMVHRGARFGWGYGRRRIAQIRPANPHLGRRICAR